ncbi:Carboxylesterase, type B [Penicillium expansum]|uniref:Carboxylesterase patB n=1 Tax=Penicillium expansum TaxID=27334 RepID=PATB_PENEN|nr:Carboxylesterase, type B [Penicillium expansum]A0A075TXZ3.1 RecName: Full=Carboxylesterase patB; AltName: Full=Patulin biosynthesis cluster protein B; Flags: Precursor [Penicillium expansum]AIG62138.1 carboxylesterase family protein [Penicillium expansum]KGO43537.1 Carboxylesterase, type B [Penicillium expansum]KGO52633.1 Carboxylesterase, type B [Penicillium expansum]KGO61366.1 Carboxylesterase, type B [Penicillium expansum]
MQIINWASLLLVTWETVVAAELPIVDLGYQRHQAIGFNSTGRYYQFSNVRYAEPPLGPLRFSLPVSPRNRSHEVVNGKGLGNICPQSQACWFNVQGDFVSAVTAGSTFNFTAAYDQVYQQDECTKPRPVADQNPLESEDCLFLDVYVPEKVISKRRDGNGKSNPGAPVLVYFQDGAYVSGSKSDQNPSGLIATSREDGSTGIIYVGVNYRLGVFGWLSGQKFQSEGGLPNAGLYDERLALEWVQRHITKFGGDPSRVTVMGVSAGGGSITMQLTAYGRAIRPPFAQIIAQSPAWEPGTKTPAIEDDLLDSFLTLLNVSSLEEARRLPSQALLDANYELVASRPYGSGVFGPAIDGSFVPDSPKRLLLERKVDPSVRILTSYTANEGFMLAPANVTDDATFNRYVDVLLRGANASVRAHTSRVLYPPIFNGSWPYHSQHERANLLWSEVSTTCNTRYLHQAVATPGYAIEYAVKPAMHLSDTSSVFYNGQGSSSSLNATIAQLMQRQIVQFVKTGNPNVKGDPHVPLYHGQAHVLSLGDNGVRVEPALTNTDRCTYWQQVEF